MNIIYSIEPEQQIIPTMESQLVSKTVNETRSIVLQDGTSLEVLTPVTTSSMQNIQTGKTYKYINVIRIESQDDSGEIARDTYYPSIIDYSLLQQDAGMEKAAELIASAGWDTNNLT